jgi:hypothetical protein
MADDPLDRHKDKYAAKIDDPVPAPDDPGGANTKGFSADPGSGPHVKDQDPLPLAGGPDTHPAVHVPERDNEVRPTGRRDQRGYSPDDRVLGADR